MIEKRRLPAITTSFNTRALSLKEYKTYMSIGEKRSPNERTSNKRTDRRLKVYLHR